MSRRPITHDVGQDGPEPTFLFDGRPIGYRLGQTVGAALVEHGILAWRTTRHGGRPRGLFCGIGVCFDCLVTVDGTPNRRACLVLGDEAREVSTQRGSGHERGELEDPAGDVARDAGTSVLDGVDD